LKRLFFTFETFVIVSSGIFLFADGFATTLFGHPADADFKARLSFRPAAPWSEQAWQWFLYPLVHLDFWHWFVALLCWIFLAFQLRNLRLPFFSIAALSALIYTSASLLIAASFWLPWAPVAGSDDLILGLSGMVLFQFALWMTLRPSLLNCLLLPLPIWILMSGESLSQWGHLAGLACGVLFGLVLRGIRGDSNALFASNLGHQK
jgi:membrane associated rhomboid family serine protease